MTNRITDAPNAELRNPFRGPHPLDVGDRIFGRNREIDALLAQLVTNRVVLLHSVSGCGKTSLIEAGLRPRLGQHRLHGLPTIRMPRRSGGPGAVTEPLLQPLHDVLKIKPAQSESEATQLARPVFDVLVFDQFEEVLDATRVSEKERLEFFKEVGRILSDRTRWALFAMREDYLGSLEPYLRFLPNYLESRFRLTQLAIDAAQKALVSICEQSGVEFEPTAAGLLAADLATTEDVATESQIQNSRLVEPVYLQVTGRYLWDLVLGQKGTEIQVDHVAKNSTGTQKQGAAVQPLIPVEIALQRYYDAAVAEAAGDVFFDTTMPSAADGPATGDGSRVSDLQERIRKWFSDELIAHSPQGEQRKQTLVVPQSAVGADTLKKLEDTYVIRKDVRNGTWYELAHDRLVQPVLRSNLAIRRRFLQPWQESAEAWSQEGENRAFLVLRGRELDAALGWAKNNPKRVTTAEQKYLDQCLAEMRLRDKLKRYRRRAVVFAVVAVVGVVAAFAYSGSRLNDARRAIAENEGRAAGFLTEATRLQELAQAAQVEMAAAKEELKQAKNQEAASFALARGSESKAAAAERQAKAARMLAENAKRDVATALDQVKQEQETAARLRAESEAERQRSVASVSAAQEQVATAAALAEAYDSLSNAQRNSVLADAVTATRKTIDHFGTRWTDRGRQVLTQSMDAIEYLFSRNLVAHAIPTDSPVLGLGLDSKSGCVHYLNETGTLAAVNMNTGQPCRASAARPAQVGQMPFVTAQAISEDASVVATGSATGQVRLTADSQEAQRNPFQAYRHEVVKSYVSPTGKYLATGNSFWAFGVADLRQWPASDSKPKQLMRRPQGGIWGWFRSINFLHGETTHTIDAFAIDEQGASVDGRGPVIATARRDGAVEVFDVLRKARLLKIPGPTERPAGSIGHDKPTAVAFDRSGFTMASGGAGGEVLVWQLPQNPTAWRELESSKKLPPVANLAACRERTVRGSSGGAVAAIAFSPDDRVLAVACQTSVVLLYYLADDFSTQTIQPLESLLTLVGQPSAIVFNKTSRTLIVGGSAARLEHWVVPTEGQMRARQKVLKDIGAARAMIAVGPTADVTGIAATLAAVATSAPETADSWGTPRPHRPSYRR